MISLLNNGLLYVIYGYRLAQLHPQDGAVINQVDLPTGEALPENTWYNGFNALPDGTLIAKTVYREQGCQVQGRLASSIAPIRETCPPRSWCRSTHRR